MAEADSGWIPVALIERCLRLRNDDGSHKVPAEARNIIRAAMDEYLRPHCTCGQAALAGLPYDPGCAAHHRAMGWGKDAPHAPLGDSEGGRDDGAPMTKPIPLHGRLFEDGGADA